MRCAEPPPKELPADCSAGHRGSADGAAGARGPRGARAEAGGAKAQEACDGVVGAGRAGAVHMVGRHHAAGAQTRGTLSARSLTVQPVCLVRQLVRCGRLRLAHLSCLAAPGAPHPLRRSSQARPFGSPAQRSGPFRRGQAAGPARRAALRRAPARAGQGAARAAAAADAADGPGPGQHHADRAAARRAPAGRLPPGEPAAAGPGAARARPAAEAPRHHRAGLCGERAGAVARRRVRRQVLQARRGAWRGGRARRRHTSVQGALLPWAWLAG